MTAIVRLFAGNSPFWRTVQYCVTVQMETVNRYLDWIDEKTKDIGNCVHGF